MKQTIIRREQAISDALLRSDLHPLLKRVYANRNISEPMDVEYRLDQLINYNALKGIDAAVEVISDALIQQKSIVIIGDYDADGATSTALMIKALRLFGHNRALYLVPNRFEYGYGLTPKIVDVALELEPDLIITVDNGISSIDGVRYAKEKGIAVVITDHHLAGRELPEADAIVNPNQPGCDFPSKCIAGVGVAFYTMLALRAKLRDSNWFKENQDVPNMAGLLDLVALGTVADVVPLDRNNRILVEQGLRRIRSRRCSPGISALLDVAGRNQTNCSSMDMAFYVAPRLNAAGRLEDMSQGIECLLSVDTNAVHKIALRLHELNVKRKDIETDMLSKALSILKSDIRFEDVDTIPEGLCLYNEAWHQGVIGLLASRVKEKYYRPVIAFADADDNEIKGSARSIPGLHIRDVLDAIATANPGLIQKFGGHAMAAGLSIHKDNYETFSQQYLAEVKRHLSREDLEKTVLSDGSVSNNEMTLDSAQALQLAGPWGQHFQEPVFDDKFEVSSWKVLGGNHLKLQLKLCDSGTTDKSQELIEAIAFNKDESCLPDEGDVIAASYRLSVNDFRNKQSLQLIIDCIEPA